MSLKRSWAKLSIPGPELLMKAKLLPSMTSWMGTTSLGQRESTDLQPKDWSTWRIRPPITSKRYMTTSSRVDILRPTASPPARVTSSKLRVVNFHMTWLPHPLLSSMNRFWTKISKSAMSKPEATWDGFWLRDHFWRLSTASEPRSSKDCKVKLGLSIPRKFTLPWRKVEL